MGRTGLNVAELQHALQNHPSTHLGAVVFFCDSVKQLL